MSDEKFAVLCPSFQTQQALSSLLTVDWWSRHVARGIKG
jgi:hypothetical protein